MASYKTILFPSKFSVYFLSSYPGDINIQSTDFNVTTLTVAWVKIISLIM
jgi:hypothetical protein